MKISLKGDKKMEQKFVEENGKTYLVLNCPHCGSELKFHLEDRERRVHCACAKCGSYLEVPVPPLKSK